MKKMTYPPFLMLVATIIATFANNHLHIKVDVDMAAGALAVVGNYLLVQFAVDIKKLKNGEIPTGSFNSVKLYTTAAVCLALGISNYYKMNLGPELIYTWAAMAMTIISGKGVKDMIKPKIGGAEIEKYPADHGPTV